MRVSVLNTRHEYHMIPALRHGYVKMLFKCYFDADHELKPGHPMSMEPVS